MVGIVTIIISVAQFCIVTADLGGPLARRGACPRRASRSSGYFSEHVLLCPRRNLVICLVINRVSFAALSGSLAWSLLFIVPCFVCFQRRRWGTACDYAAGYEAFMSVRLPCGCNPGDPDIIRAGGVHHIVDGCSGWHPHSLQEQVRMAIVHRAAVINCQTVFWRFANALRRTLPFPVQEHIGLDRRDYIENVQANLGYPDLNLDHLIADFFWGPLDVDMYLDPGVSFCMSRLF